MAASVADEQHRDVLLVQGARQVGKTTLVEHVLSTSPLVYAVNLERDIDLLRSIDRTSSFDEFTRLLQIRFNVPVLDQAGAILFIDEAQESVKLGSYLRFMKEEWQHIRVILSGSSMSRIFRQGDRVPVGRYRPWLVTPLVFSEFLAASPHLALQQIYREFCDNPREELITGEVHAEFLKATDEYMTVGGLPAVVTDYFAGGDYRGRRQFIFNSQEDDFVRKSSLADRALFSRGLRGVANFLGMPAKYSHVHESKKIVDKIISEEVAWHLLIEVEQKGMASTSQHLPKRYLYDIGMAQDLRDMPFPRLSLVTTSNPALRTQLGGLFENALLLQLLAAQTYLGGLSGWRKGGSDGPEVDFIWRHNADSLALECKATQKLSVKHWSGLKAYLEATDQKIGFLVSAAPFAVVRSKQNVLVNLPIYLASAANILKCREQFLS